MTPGSRHTAAKRTHRLLLARSTGKFPSLVNYNSSTGMFPTSTSVQIDNIISIGPDFIKVSMKVDDRLIFSMVI